MGHIHYITQVPVSCHLRGMDVAGTVTVMVPTLIPVTHTATETMAMLHIAAVMDMTPSLGLAHGTTALIMRIASFMGQTTPTATLITAVLLAGVQDGGILLPAVAPAKACIQIHSLSRDMKGYGPQY